MNTKQISNFLIKYRYFFAGGAGLGVIVLASFLGWINFQKHQVKKIESQIYSYRSDLEQTETKHKGSVLSGAESIQTQKVSDYSLIEPSVNRYVEFLKSTANPRAVHWLATLELGYFLTEYSKYKEAVDLLSHIQSKKTSDNWTYQLLLLKLGSLFMHEKNFTRALHIFSLLLGSKKDSPFHLEARIKSALCYEALGEGTKAQEIYALIRKNEAHSLYNERVLHYDRLNKIKNQLQAKKPSK